MKTKRVNEILKYQGISFLDFKFNGQIGASVFTCQKTGQPSKEISVERLREMLLRQDLSSVKVTFLWPEGLVEKKFVDVMDNEDDKLLRTIAILMAQHRSYQRDSDDTVESIKDLLFPRTKFD